MMSRQPDAAIWDSTIGEVKAERANGDGGDAVVWFAGHRYRVEDVRELAEAFADAIDWLDQDEADFQAWRAEKHSADQKGSDGADPGYTNMIGRRGPVWTCLSKARHPMGDSMHPFELKCDRVYGVRNPDPMTWGRTHRHHFRSPQGVEWVWVTNGEAQPLVRDET